MRGKIVVDLSTLQENVNYVKSKCDCKIIGVVKDDAYGHGSLEIVKSIENIDVFAVATFDEAYEIRKNFADKKLLILGHLYDILI